MNEYVYCLLQRTEEDWFELISVFSTEELALRRRDKEALDVGWETEAELKNNFQIRKMKIQRR